MAHEKMEREKCERKNEMKNGVSSFWFALIKFPLGILYHRSVPHSFCGIRVIFNKMYEFALGTREMTINLFQKYKKFHKNSLE